MKKHLLAALAALLVAGPALAERSVERSVEADPDGEVSIELIAGDLQIVGWDRDVVEIRGTLGSEEEELDVSRRGHHVSIEVEFDDSHGYRNVRDATRLEIHVPSNSRLDIETISGAVHVEAVRGAVDAETVSGTIEIEDGPNEVDLASVSGKIRLDSAGSLREGEFETVSGNIEWRGPLARSGRYSFESVSGTIELHLPSSVSAEFEISTFSGSIDSDLGPAPRKKSEFLPAKSLSFTAGGGDASVELESFSGRVRIKVE